MTNWGYKDEALVTVSFTRPDGSVLETLSMEVPITQMRLTDYLGQELDFVGAGGAGQRPSMPTVW